MIPHMVLNKDDTPYVKNIEKMFMFLSAIKNFLTPSKKIVNFEMVILHVWLFVNTQGAGEGKVYEG